jgi:hypothetical protein
MPVINGVYLKDFTALPGAVADANIIPIAISGNPIAYRTTVSGIVTDARVTSKILTGLSVTGGAISATDTILQAFGKVQNQINGKQGTITLTTIGTSGAATFIANTLNIPNYADGGVLSLSAIGATPNANAATITGTVLNLQPASSSFGGVVTTAAQTFAGDKTLTGALVGTTGSFASSGGSDSFAINHSSGAGIALNITKGGNGEGIYVNKTSGSGNAATIIGTLNATTIVKSGGTSSQFLKADGTVDSTAYGTGSVTSVAALTLGTSGTDLSSTVANSTTTPVITLNVPDASATARGVVTTGNQTFAGEKTFNNNLISEATSWFSTNGLRKLTAGIDVPLSNSAGTVEFNFGNGGNFTANSLIKSGGTSAQFLMADGSVNTSVLPSGAYLPLTGGTLTGALSGTSASFSSSATASAFIPSGASVPTNGMYLSAANTLDFATNSVNRLSISLGGTATFANQVFSNAAGNAFFAQNGLFYKERETNGTGGTPTFEIALGYGVSSTTYGSFQFGNEYASNLKTSARIVLHNGTAAYVAQLIDGGTGVVTFSNLGGTGSRTVLADANGALSAPVSDISVKQNIKPIGYGLNEVLKMNPVWFDFVNDYKNYGQGRQNGNIAQELANIIPEAVFTTPSTGKMGINYDQLHAVYIKAIQELKEEIDILKNK